VEILEVDIFPSWSKVHLEVQAGVRLGGIISFTAFSDFLKGRGGVSLYVTELGVSMLKISHSPAFAR
jgi:hypothetical protein